MPIDASIYNAFAPRVQSPMDVQNGLMQQANAGLQMQNQQLALRQAQAVDQQKQALRQAVQSGQLDLNNPAHQDQALAQYPDVAPALLKSVQDRAQVASKTKLETAQAGEHDIKAQAGKVALMGQKLSAINPNDDNAVANWYRDGVKSGLIDQDSAMAEIQKVPPAGPERMKWFAAQQQMGLALKDQMENAIKLQEEQGRNTRNTADIQGRAATNAATNATSRANNSATIAGENKRHGETIANQRLIAGINPDGSPRGASADGTIDLKQVSPEDLAAAYRYKTDGTLPPNMGRGAQGAAESRRLRSIAAAIDAQGGESPEDARVRQLALKGDVSAINKMRQREVAVGANVKNFDFNADQVEQMSKKVDRTGVPIVNAWVNAGRRAVTGNPDLSAFDTAIKTTVNEFAQIVSGTTSGATAEGEKKKAEALLNAQQTPEQIIAVVNQMRIESKNRMASFKAQRAESMPTNAAQAPSKVVHFGDLK